MSQVFEINQRLLRVYGRDTIYDQPNYRVVWSEQLTEKREGEYEDYTPAGIYLGKKTGIREVKKYDYLKPCWVLEKFHPTFTRGTYDEVHEPYTFEPLYVFLSKSDEQLPLIYRACELVIQTFMNAERQHIDMQAAEEKAKKDEVDRTRDILHADDPLWKPTFKASVSVKEEVGEKNEH